MPQKLHFAASDTTEAQAALARLTAPYGDCDAADAEVIVALGGDGFMLQALHAFLGSGLPIYGMNLGSVGFLMNEYCEDALRERLAAAEPARVHPLRMTAQSAEGERTA